MTDPRLKISYVEFYVTNVCNLTCQECNRFNNHDFRGWQNWADHDAAYTEWGKHLDIEKIAILGGEPLLNPTILDWVDGINRIWNKRVQILSNGTRLNHVPDLYDRFFRFRDPLNPYLGNWLGVSLHNSNDRERCFEEIRRFLRGEITYYHRSDPKNIDNRWTYGADHAFVDSNGARVHVWEYDSFYPAAVQRNQMGRFALHRSDPERAHQGCGFVHFKCYHFIRGKLYKCGPVALFPEFDQQHKFDITDEEREILYGYQPLTADRVAEHGKQFLEEIDNVIPQCRFCPDFSKPPIQNIKLYSVSKKPGSVSSYD